MGNLKLKKETKADKYLLSIPQAASKYGIGKETMYSLVRSDLTLPIIKIGSITKINTPLFEEWLDKKTREGGRIL